LTANPVTFNYRAHRDSDSGLQVTYYTEVKKKGEQAELWSLIQISPARLKNMLHVSWL